jgi:putative transposase
MARLARILWNDIAYHVTQRGNARQTVFHSDSDRRVYLDLLRTNCRIHKLSLLGYCLMSNHVHLIVVARETESLPATLKHTHGRYATYFNARQAASGHVWQGRYYSCPLDDAHLWEALRYTELNPVRAGMVEDPCDYVWSSAAAHLGWTTDLGLETDSFASRWTTADWLAYLNEAATQQGAEIIRKHTHTGRPLGSAEFVERLEESTQRRLAPQKGGRPYKQDLGDRQLVFA